MVVGGLGAREHDSFSGAVSARIDTAGKDAEAGTSAAPSGPGSGRTDAGTNLAHPTPLPTSSLFPLVDHSVVDSRGLGGGIGFVFDPFPGLPSAACRLL